MGIFCSEVVGAFFPMAALAWIVFAHLAVLHNVSLF